MLADSGLGLPIFFVALSPILMSSVSGQNCLYNGSSSLSVRAPPVQSQAYCESAYDWMSNSLGQSPCLVLGYLLSQCNEGDWTVPALATPGHYSTPGSNICDPIQPCDCSWVAYNLYSACTLCQGPDQMQSVVTWATYSYNCSAYLPTSSFYPKNITIPSDTAVQYWATIDPSTWPSGIFDLNSAHTISNQDKPDFTNANESPKAKKASIGPIVGGVVGGVVVLSTIIGLIVWHIRKRRRQTEDVSEEQSGGVRPAFHKHALSDGSQYTDWTQTQTQVAGSIISPGVTSVIHQNTFVSRPTSGETTLRSTPTPPAASGSPGFHRRVTSQDNDSTTSLHQHSRSIDAILSSPPRKQLSTYFNNNQELGDVMASSSTARVRLNPPTYADAMGAGSPGPDNNGASHSRSPSNDSTTQLSGPTPDATPKGEKKKRSEKKTPLEEANTLANATVDRAASDQDYPLDEENMSADISGEKKGEE